MLILTLEHIPHALEENIYSAAAVRMFQIMFVKVHLVYHVVNLHYFLTDFLNG